MGSRAVGIWVQPILRPSTRIYPLGHPRRNVGGFPGANPDRYTIADQRRNPHAAANRNANTAHARRP